MRTPITTTEFAHDSTRTLPTPISVAARVAAIPIFRWMIFGALWDDHFDERPNHLSGLAGKSPGLPDQERAFGGLNRHCAKVEEVGETGICPQLRGDTNAYCPVPS